MLSLRPGSLIKYEKKEWTIEGYTQEGFLLLRELKSRNRTKIISVEHLWNELEEENKEEQTEDLWTGFTERQKEEALRRYRIIEPLINPDIKRTKHLVRQVAQVAGVNQSTIYEWLKRYRERGLLGLAPLNSLKGNRTSRLSAEQEEIMQKAIQEYYLSQQKLNIKAVYELMLLECRKRNIPPPHYNTLRYKIKGMSRLLVEKKREGNEIHPVKDSYNPKYPLEVIEIDHTKLDIIVVDPIFRKPVGRPYITVALDVFSRMIYGFYLSLDPPSYFSVGQTLLMGIRPKDSYLRRLNIDGSWNIFGIPGHIILHTDNAMEFQSKQLEFLLGYLGISQQFRPKGKPHYGGHIERFFRTLNEELHRLPGTTFSDVQKRGKYRPEEEASLTLDELERYIVQWIVGVYHKRPHSSLRKSPEEKFLEGILGTQDRPGTGYPDVPAPEELRRLEIELLPTYERTLTRKGIVLDYITYWSDTLISLYAKSGGKKCRIKADPRDARFIYVYDEQGKDYIKAYCRNLSFPVMTRWELRQVIEYMKEKQESMIDENTIAQAYEVLLSIKEDAVLKKKSARRDLERKRTQLEKMGYLEMAAGPAKAQDAEEEQKEHKTQLERIEKLEVKPLKIIRPFGGGK